MSSCCKTFVYLEDMFYDRLQWLIHHLFLSLLCSIPPHPHPSEWSTPQQAIFDRNFTSFSRHKHFEDKICVFIQVLLVIVGADLLLKLASGWRAAEQRHPASCFVTRQFPWKLLNWRELWPRPRLTAHPWRTARRANQRAPFKDATVNDVLAAPKSC